MDSYRFHLEKWTVGTVSHSNKHVCPNCGKRCFVRYVDERTGGYLADHVGRCDREESCGYHYPPRAFFRDHPEFRPTVPEVPSPRRATEDSRRPARVWTIELPFFNQTQGVGSALKTFLESRLGSGVQGAWEAYRIGGTADGRVVFWQIDSQGRIRIGKVMRYDSHTGHRVKNSPGSFNWVHADLRRRGHLPKEWQLSQVLFGEHLLSPTPDAPVCLVEAEKTAVVCSLFLPKYIWLATGGLENFRAEVCGCLKGRRIRIYPDLGAFEKWSRKAEELSVGIGFEYSMSSLLEEKATDEERREGLDLADYLLRTTE